ncbi:hypothetical protein [Serratia fonticola]|uniref:Uncharacterized protein n=1 Tax=Serratia fonticola TaxID=47917 RepID=A0AAW3WSW4_SERFO|nr:hypothetical protein [Serratia fonticola]MBC3212712.1 hypothetical protein [Serratia fonticola]NYA11282.1 hypothetical protein [Serratia fonticola]NYA31186.1 hypothetical protein [Serratia fonticola]
MIEYLKYMFWLLGVIVSSASAGQFGTPVSICLNDQTIPLINTDKPAVEIVNTAYEQCHEVILQWKEQRKLLPPEMVAKQDEELHDFYVHMIEVRRKTTEKAK